MSHGCIKIQINNQGKGLVNEIMTTFHKMTGADQKITSAYHPQANGLAERQNRTINDSLVIVLNERAADWPYFMERTRQGNSCLFYNV